MIWLSGWDEKCDKVSLTIIELLNFNYLSKIIINNCWSVCSRICTWNTLWRTVCFNNSWFKKHDVEACESFLELQPEHVRYRIHAQVKKNKNKKTPKNNKTTTTTKAHGLGQKDFHFMFYFISPRFLHPKTLHLWQ